MIAKAIEIACRAHAGQVDKGGEDYILHPLAVMDLAASLCPLGADNFRRDVMTVAVMHDAVEDSRKQDRSMIWGVVASEFDQTIYEALHAITKAPGEDYGEYIERVAANPIARIVKIADLTHNMDTGRLPEGEIGEKDFERWDKYRRALVRLKRED